jgi:hypothetical protein
MQWSGAEMNVCGYAGKCIACDKAGAALMTIANKCKNPWTGLSQGVVKYVLFAVLVEGRKDS